jgi:hypothetical protein
MPIPHALRFSARRALTVVVALGCAAPLGLMPLALPVAAAAVPPVLTIVSTSTWSETGRVPALHLVGEVRNDDASQTAQHIMVNCRLLTVGGTLVREETGATDAEVLRPTEASPFDVLFLSPPAYDHYACATASAASPVQPDHNFSTTIAPVTTDPVAGTQTISGTVTNLNTVSVSNARLLFTFYRNATDSPLQTIAEDWLWVNYGNPLAPSSVTPFTLTRFSPAPTWNGAKAALLAEAPTPAVSLSPTQVSVTQIKTTTSSAQLVSLTNLGTADLHIGALTFAGAHPGDWAETDTCAGATITPLGSCSISLTFTPTDVGDRSATLNVADDANQTPQSMTLTGTGIDPRATPSPSPLAFDPLAIGATSPARNLTVTNSGVGNLQIATVVLSGTNAGDFSITANGCAGTTVAPGSTCTVALTFHPSATGQRVATLTINDNALDSPQTVSLTGSGVSPAVAFDPPSRAYGFGNEKLGATSAATSVTIINNGVSPLAVSSVCSSAPAEFSLGANACIPGFTVNPGMSMAIPVTFTPLQTGTRVATVTFTDNAADNPQTVTLSGNGTFGGQYHPLAPARIYDSRNGAGPLGAGSARTVSVTGVGGVRVDAVAVVLNVTVTNTTASSFLTVFPSGVTQPTASNLNWVAGQTVPNLVEVGVRNGSVDIFNALGSADVIFDVAGYVAPEGDAPGPAGFYTPVVPARVLDTRNAIGAPTAPVPARGQIDVPVTGVGNVPPLGAAAVVLNVTVTNPSAPSFLTVFPTGGSPPVISNLNFVAGQTVPNRVIVKVGAGGMVSFYNQAGRVDVIADVAGWFSDATAGGTGAGFNPLAPTRILDTRDGTGGFHSAVGQTPIALTIAAVAGIPGPGSATPPTAVVLNVTVANPNAPSFLTLWPDGANRPAASDLNFLAGQVTSNLVVVKVGADGKVGIFNAAGTTNVIVDVVGWYS